MKNLTFCLFMFFLLRTSMGQVIHVPLDFPTIQQGIDASQNGDTILVDTGTYFENINFFGKNIVVSSHFILTGDSSFIYQTKIDGSENGRVVTFANGEDSTAKICGLTITNGYASEGAGIYISSASPTIANNYITNNSGYWYCLGTGIYLSNSSSSIHKNVIHNNSMAIDGAGLCINSCSNMTISHNIISKNTSFSGYGVAEGAGAYVLNSENILMKNNLFFENDIDCGYGDMITSYNSSLTIDNCTFYNFSSSGISLELHDDVEITNCIIWSSETYYGTEISGDGQTTVSFSNIKNGYEGEGNIDQDPLFQDFETFGLEQQSPCINRGNPLSPPDPDGTICDLGWEYFDLSDYGTVSGKVTLGNGLGKLIHVSIQANDQFTRPIHDSTYSLHLLPDIYNISAKLGLHQEDIQYNVEAILNEETDGIDFSLPNTLQNMAIHIKQDGSGDFTEIQPGIDIALPGDTVLVYPGTYTEELKIIEKPVVMGSLFLIDNNPEYIESTILHGNNFRPLKIENIEDTTLSISGLTLENGQSDYGGGMYIRNSKPRIMSCKIRNNIATKYGGGIDNQNSAPVFRNCTISQNEAGHGGGIANENSNAEIYSCEISDNLATIAGGIHHVSDSGIIMNSIIKNNITTNGNGGGINMMFVDQPMIINNIITGNTSPAGAGVYIQGSLNPVLANNLIYDNHSTGSGGGIKIRMSSPIIVNNTIAANQADTHGGGICFYDYCSPKLYNNIIWGNETPVDDQIAIESQYSQPDFYYCDIEGGVEDFYFTGSGSPGAYNGACVEIISDDPKFISMEDFQLQPGSPCIDAGNPDTNGLFLPEFDLKNNLRLWDGDGNGSVVVDIGAYEFASVPVGIKKLHNADKTDIVFQYPNPFSNSTTFSYKLSRESHIHLSIYDMNGILVEDIVDENQVAGEHQVIWNTKQLNGGVYFYKFKAGSRYSTNKMIHIK